MPSQIKVDEIKNVAGQYKIKTNVFEGQTTAGSITVQGEGTATTTLQQGLIKVWYSVDMYNNTNNIEGSLNLSSITDTSTGSNFANYTNNMSDQNYTPAGMSTDANIMGTGNASTEGNSSRQTNLFKGRVRTHAGSIQDAYHYNQIVGALA